MGTTVKFLGWTGTNQRVCDGDEYIEYNFTEAQSSASILDIQRSDSTFFALLNDTGVKVSSSAAHIGSSTPTLDVQGVLDHAGGLLRLYDKTGGQNALLVKRLTSSTGRTTEFLLGNPSQATTDSIGARFSYNAQSATPLGKVATFGYVGASPGFAYNELLNVNSDGTVHLTKSSGANMVWDTNGGGTIGSLAGSNRPAGVYATSVVLAQNVYGGTSATLASNSVLTNFSLTLNGDSPGTNNKIIYAEDGSGASSPAIQYNEGTNKWEFKNAGGSFAAFSSSSTWDDIYAADSNGLAVSTDSKPFYITQTSNAGYAFHVHRNKTYTSSNSAVVYIHNQGGATSYDDDKPALHVYHQAQGGSDLKYGCAVLVEAWSSLSDRRGLIVVDAKPGFAIYDDLSSIYRYQITDRGRHLFVPSLANVTNGTGAAWYMDFGSSDPGSRDVMYVKHPTTSGVLWRLKGTGVAEIQANTGAESALKVGQNQADTTAKILQLYQGRIDSGGTVRFDVHYTGLTTLTPGSNTQSLDINCALTNVAGDFSCVTVDPARSVDLIQDGKDVYGIKSTVYGRAGDASTTRAIHAGYRTEFSGTLPTDTDVEITGFSAGSGFRYGLYSESSAAVDVNTTTAALIAAQAGAGELLLLKDGTLSAGSNRLKVEESGFITHTPVNPTATYTAYNITVVNGGLTAKWSGFTGLNVDITGHATDNLMAAQGIRSVYTQGSAPAASTTGVVAEGDWLVGVGSSSPIATIWSGTTLPIYQSGYGFGLFNAITYNEEATPALLLTLADAYDGGNYPDPPIIRFKASQNGSVELYPASAPCTAWYCEFTSVSPLLDTHIYCYESGTGNNNYFKVTATAQTTIYTKGPAGSTYYGLTISTQGTSGEPAGNAYPIRLGYGSGGGFVEEALISAGSTSIHPVDLIPQLSLSPTVTNTKSLLGKSAFNFTYSSPSSYGTTGSVYGLDVSLTQVGLDTANYFGAYFYTNANNTSGGTYGVYISQNWQKGISCSSLVEIQVSDTANPIVYASQTSAVSTYPAIKAKNSYSNASASVVELDSAYSSSIEGTRRAITLTSAKTNRRYIPISHFLPHSTALNTEDFRYSGSLTNDYWTTDGTSNGDYITIPLTLPHRSTLDTVVISQDCPTSATGTDLPYIGLYQKQSGGTLTLVGSLSYAASAGSATITLSPSAALDNSAYEYVIRYRNCASGSTGATYVYYCYVDYSISDLSAPCGW